MKEQIFLKIKQLLHYSGFIIERIPDENKLFDELNLVDESGKRHILKRLTSNMKIANNHKRYNSLLKRYVPKWNYNFSRSEFVGSGLGEFSFNTFRKVYFQDKWYFEKIYFNNTSDLARIEWFYEHLFPLLDERIKVTKLFRIIKGEIFTIVYFDYTNLTPVKDADANELSLYFSKVLFQASTSPRINEVCLNSPVFLKDYRMHFGYRRNITFAAKEIEKLSNGRLSPPIIEEIIDLQPLVLTHGDIQRTNIYADSYLIDWDSFGFFPIGYESACVLYERKEILKLTELRKLLTATFKPIVNLNIWDEFELCFFYFYFIFISLKEDTSQTIALKKDVFGRIESLYETARQSIDKCHAR